MGVPGSRYRAKAVSPAWAVLGAWNLGGGWGLVGGSIPGFSRKQRYHVQEGLGGLVGVTKAGAYKGASGKTKR